jgi:hypothetical protein
MSLMNRNADTFRLRVLAHELRTSLESDQADAPLFNRVSKLLDAHQVWVHAVKPNTRGSSELRARAQRTGLGRSYIEEVSLKVDQDNLNLNVSMWVRESDRNYFAGSWTLRENLGTGDFSYNYSR